MLESRRSIVAIHVEYGKFVLCFCSNQKRGSFEVERVSVICGETLCAVAPAVWQLITPCCQKQLISVSI
jgi:hypothetical protein